MFDISLLKARIISETGYQIETIQAKEIMPKIPTGQICGVRVGYLNNNAMDVTSRAITPDLYDQGWSDIIQTIEVHFVAMEQDIPTVWKALYAACCGWNPIPAEEVYSGMTYSEGGVIGIDNGKYWWLDRWTLSFPRVTNL